ncbi:MAG: hypothetical protein ACQERK_02840 [Campylobacterota bacterium]
MYRLIIVLAYLLIAYQSFTLPIGPSEAHYIQGQNSIVTFLAYLGGDYFRLAFFLLSTVNFILFYRLGGYYLRYQKDRVIALSVFMLLPGVISSAVLVDPSSVSIFLVLVFLLAYKKKQSYLQTLSLLALLFVNPSSAILFFALFVYAVVKKEKVLLQNAIILFTAAAYMGGFDVGGKPQGRFLETFALLAVIFSPFFFLYFLYSLYRVVTERQKDILWYIVTVSLAMIMLFSFRQHIDIEQSAPFLVIGVIMTVDMFSRSYRVRLRPFRKVYKTFFTLIYLSLFVTAMVLLNNAWLYHFITPSHHFAHTFYQPYALASSLQQNGYACVDAGQTKLQYQLQTYGIDYCSEYVLHSNEVNNADKLQLTYKNFIFDPQYVTKVNK